ncbi:Ionotropic receptor 226 [Frankliniella occidentalis]|nr:Ionotropic receptor 226 [Frankliniella occidentalis]
MQRVALLGFLCAGAQAVWPVPTTSHGPGPKCIVDLLSTLLSPANGSVIIIGDGRYTSSLVKELPPGIPRTVLVDHTVIGDWLEYRFNTLNAIFVIARESGSNTIEFDLRIPEAARVLVWIHAKSPESLLRLPRDKQLRYCAPQKVALAFGTVNESSALYSVTNQCDFNSPTITAKKVNSCKALAPKWEKSELVLPRLCSGWHHSPANSPLPITHAVTSETLVGTQYFMSLLAQALEVPVRMDPVFLLSDHLRVVEAIDECRMAALASIRPMVAPAASNTGYEGISTCAVVVLVPTGRGSRLHLLQAVTEEFSAGLWIATTLTVLCVAAAMAAALALGGRASLSLALLETVAPLLAQAPPSRPAHPTLSAVWLLTSVVITAAYQGLLLEALTTPIREINSLEELEKSDLLIKLDLDLLKDGRQLLPHTLVSRMEIVDMMNRQSIKEVLERRDSALVCDYDSYSRFVLAPWLESRQFHLFQLRAMKVKAHFRFTTGSPLEGHIRLALRRIEAAGLKYVSIFTVKKKCSADHLPLGLDDLQPAFLLLAFGLCASALSFAFELLYSSPKCSKLKSPTH